MPSAVRARNTARSSSGSAGAIALGLLLFGIVLVLAGFANVAGSHEDPSAVGCDNTAMKPGGTCITYSNSSPVRTETYDQVRADHIASIERGKTQGPLFVVIGSIMIGGFFLSVVILAAAGRRART